MERNKQHALNLMNLYHIKEHIREGGTIDTYTEKQELPQGMSVEEVINKYLPCPADGWNGWNQWPQK